MWSVNAPCPRARAHTVCNPTPNHGSSLVSHVAATTGTGGGHAPHAALHEASM